MANPYFKNLPDFEYVSRTKGSKKISDYNTVKNLFKKGKLRNDIFQDTTFFQKYQIKGDDRPDNVAYEIYDDPSLDWIILLSNNIINIQNEWPMQQSVFDEYLLEKYGSYNNLNSIHHYESIEVTNSQGNVIFPKGIRIDSDQTVSYFDFMADTQITTSNIATPISNYKYEEKINDDKRNIFVLKAIYLNVVFDDLEEMMTYKEGSTQYLSETLKRAENIRLYQ